MFFRLFLLNTRKKRKRFHFGTLWRSSPVSLVLTDYPYRNYLYPLSYDFAPSTSRPRAEVSLVFLRTDKPGKASSSNHPEIYRNVESDKMYNNYIGNIFLKKIVVNICKVVPPFFNTISINYLQTYTLNTGEKNK